MENEKRVVEYRGCEGLVCAILKEDSIAKLTYGFVFPLAGLGELSKAVSASTDSHYYDNEPKVNVTAVGPDEVNLNTSAIPLEYKALILGEDYDEETGTYTEGNADPPYCALGYITEETDGTLYFVWRYKGTFAVPDENIKTKDGSTDASGCTLVYKGINTIHKFYDGKTRKSCVHNSSKGIITKEEFFSKVTTIDDLRALLSGSSEPGSQAG